MSSMMSPSAGGAIIARALICAIVVSFAFGVGSTRAESQTERQNAVKAGFIYNFAKFAVWPDSALAGKDKFTFCVGENKEFSRIFRLVTNRKKIGLLPVEVKDVMAGQPVEECQVLYVPDNEPETIKSFMENPSEAPVLSVGDSKDFAVNGGIIGFYVDSGRIRFEICLSKATNRGITISSELLSLAKIRQNC